jgi:hypothetical protein
MRWWRWRAKNERGWLRHPARAAAGLTDILRGLAGERGLHLADLQRQFAYDRLLCRVFIVDPGGWVLRGAVAMLARMRGVARHTWDVDISRRVGDLKEAEAALREAAARDLHDHFRFELGPGRLIAQGGRALRFPVVAYVGATPFAEFRVDLTAGLDMTGTPDDVPPLVPVELPGVVQTRYRAYPVVDHIADKVCAIFEVHERADGTPVTSTRYRDLLDLVVFAHSESVTADALATALQAEFRRRGLGLPERFAVPEDAAWRPGYTRVVRDAPAVEERDLYHAVMTSGRFLDPVLAGEGAGRWDPETLAWRA